MSIAAIETPEVQEAAEPKGFQYVRWGIWVYIFFLLFEGVLRKWVLPGLSGPLLVIRDPIVIAIYIVALSVRAFPTPRLLISLAWVCLVVSVAGLLAQSFAPSVYLYGWRSDFLHFPLI